MSFFFPSSSSSSSSLSSPSCENCSLHLAEMLRIHELWAETKETLKETQTQYNNLLIHMNSSERKFHSAESQFTRRIHEIQRENAALKEEISALKEQMKNQNIQYNKSIKQSNSLVSSVRLSKENSLRNSLKFSESEEKLRESLREIIGKIITPKTTQSNEKQQNPPSPFPPLPFDVSLPLSSIFSVLSSPPSHFVVSAPSLSPPSPPTASFLLRGVLMEIRNSERQRSARKQIALRESQSRRLYEMRRLYEWRLPYSVVISTGKAKALRREIDDLRHKWIHAELKGAKTTEKGNSAVSPNFLHFALSTIGNLTQRLTEVEGEFQRIQKEIHAKGKNTMKSEEIQRTANSFGESPDGKKLSVTSPLGIRRVANRPSSPSSSAHFPLDFPFFSLRMSALSEDIETLTEDLRFKIMANLRTFVGILQSAIQQSGGNDLTVLMESVERESELFVDAIEDNVEQHNTNMDKIMEEFKDTKKDKNTENKGRTIENERKMKTLSGEY